VYEVKKTVAGLILFVLLLFPLACVQRGFQSPVNPQVNAATATPTMTPTIVPSLICTITPTATMVTQTESEGVSVTGSNDSFGTSQNLGPLSGFTVFLYGTLAGTQGAPDNDYYSFTAGVTGTWNIYLDCYWTPPSPTLYVYDSGQNLLGGTAAVYSANPNLACALSATSGQTYYIRVSGYGGAGYTLKVYHP